MSGIPRGLNSFTLTSHLSLPGFLFTKLDGSDCFADVKSEICNYEFALNIAFLIVVFDADPAISKIFDYVELIALCNDTK